MLAMLSCAEQYNCKSVKTQMHNEHLMEEQHVCTYNHTQKPEA